MFWLAARLALASFRGDTRRMSAFRRRPALRLGVMDLAAPQAKTSPGKPGAAGRGRARPGWLALLDRPLTSYYLILGITVLLIVLGLIMVLSTSSAVALDHGGPTYGGFQKQLIGVAVGLPLMWAAAKSSPTLF